MQSAMGVPLQLMVFFVQDEKSKTRKIKITDNKIFILLLLNFYR
jgi:hypothetical protein